VTDSPLRFSDAERAAVYRAIAERRDMRHFKPDPIEAATLERLLNAAHCAPSVGLMQPWRFVRVTDHNLREQIHALVEEERRQTAVALGSRGDEFLSLKVQGVLECGELLIAALCERRDQHVFGRRTLPQMDLASAACAIQNLWLAARAEGIGMGWVSLFDPDALAVLLGMPEDSLPIAILCLGHVDAFYPAPMLELTGWIQGRPLHELLFLDRWNNAAVVQNLTTTSAP
jgi:5,6-dimethylbenzimidazole synthase